MSDEAPLPSSQRLMWTVTVRFHPVGAINWFLSLLGSYHLQSQSWKRDN